VRLALALVVVAVAWAAAVWVHQRRVDVPIAPPWGAACPDGGCSVRSTHPSWEDPVAVLLAVGGVAVAVAIVATGRRRAE